MSIEPTAHDAEAHNTKTLERELAPDVISRNLRQAGVLGVRSLDLTLRLLLGIREFSRRSDCILRVAETRADSPVLLPDGSVVSKGAPVLELHLWNEHLVHCLGPHGLFGWSLCLERRIRLSLMLLAEYVSTHQVEPEYQAVCARFSMSLDRADRLIRRLGFSVHYPARTASQEFHDGLDRLLNTSLTWTFRPFGLQPTKRLPRHAELWMSKADFVRLYGNSFCGKD